LKKENCVQRLPLFGAFVGNGKQNNPLFSFRKRKSKCMYDFHKSKITIISGQQFLKFKKNKILIFLKLKVRWNWRK